MSTEMCGTITVKVRRKTAADEDKKRIAQLEKIKCVNKRAALGRNMQSRGANDVDRDDTVWIHEKW